MLEGRAEKGRESVPTWSSSSWADERNGHASVAPLGYVESTVEDDGHDRRRDSPTPRARGGRGQRPVAGRHDPGRWSTSKSTSGSSRLTTQPRSATTVKASAPRTSSA